MSVIGILYASGSRTGSGIGRLAEVMGEVVEELGHRAVIARFAELPTGLTLSGLDAVVVGMPMQPYDQELALGAWIAQHRDTLNRLPSGAFSVAPNYGVGGSQAQRRALTHLRAFEDRTGWRPRQTATFTGPLTYARYLRFGRRVLRFIARTPARGERAEGPRDHPDWAEVRLFAERIVECVGGEEPGTTR